jgi:hypothetical protein
MSKESSRLADFIEATRFIKTPLHCRNAENTRFVCQFLDRQFLLKFAGIMIQNP